MPRCVARRQQTLEAIAPRLQHIARKKTDVAVGGDRGHGPGRVLLRPPGQQPGREALGGKNRVGLFPPGGPKALQQAAVRVADINAPRPGHQLRRQAGVVGVEMGQQYIGVLPAHLQLSKRRQQSLAAGFLPESGVNQQAALPAANQVAVELLQGIAGQGDRDTEQVRAYHLRHGGSLLLVWFGISSIAGRRPFVNRLLGPLFRSNSTLQGIPPRAMIEYHFKIDSRGVSLRKASQLRPVFLVLISACFLTACMRALLWMAVPWPF